MRQRGSTEVFTPALLQHTLAHPSTRVFSVVRDGAPAPAGLYLQPSPELAMRALVARGSGSIFQIGSAFRDEEEDATHKREFILLEWYAPGRGYLEFASDVCRLIEHHVPRPVKQYRCRDLFERSYGADLHRITAEGIGRLFEESFGANARSPGEPASHHFDRLLMRAMADCAAGSIVCLTDYPMLDPCFAKEAPGNVAQRFEIFLDGVEVANGYQEIESQEEFLERFEFENHQRVELGIPALPVPEVENLPPCSGVAVGLERILAISLGRQSIHEA